MTRLVTFSNSCWFNDLCIAAITIFLFIFIAAFMSLEFLIAVGVAIKKLDFVSFLIRIQHIRNHSHLYLFQLIGYRPLFLGSPLVRFYNIYLLLYLRETYLLSVISWQALPGILYFRTYHIRCLSLLIAERLGSYFSIILWIWLFLCLPLYLL